ncbi:hypothetical protein [Haliscomenobacter hydrossis]|nr:hypothetical protein [Haliscomenobacter hydrossis]
MRQLSPILECTPKIILFPEKQSQPKSSKHRIICYNIKTKMACPEGKP